MGGVEWIVSHPSHPKAPSRPRICLDLPAAQHPHPHARVSHLTLQHPRAAQAGSRMHRHSRVLHELIAARSGHAQIPSGGVEHPGRGRRKQGRILRRGEARRTQVAAAIKAPAG